MHLGSKCKRFHNSLTLSLYIYSYATVSHEVQNVFGTSRRISHFHTQNTDPIVQSVLHIKNRLGGQIIYILYFFLFFLGLENHYYWKS
jgi:hypothetical protein